MRTSLDVETQVSGGAMRQIPLRSEAMQLAVTGPFDLPTALDIARSLSDVSEEMLVRIDLTRVSHFDDSGVAVLARAMTGHRHTEVRGLRQHQVRLLRYLGVEDLRGSMVDAEPGWTS
jgi:ABC-type transporter Mla MlaB component